MYSINNICNNYFNYMYWESIGLSVEGILLTL